MNGRFAGSRAKPSGGMARQAEASATSDAVDNYSQDAATQIPFDAAFLSGQWYSEPSYGGAETYTLLGVDYDRTQHGGRAYWPRGYSTSP